MDDFVDQNSDQSVDESLPFAVASLELDPKGAQALYRQLYDGIRTAILDGRLPAGARLPPTRTLAQVFRIGRSTAIAAYEELLAEGYVLAHVGRGTVVADMPAEAKFVAQGRDVAERVLAPTPALSRRGTSLLQQPFFMRSTVGPFEPGMPDTTQFPRHIWAQLLAGAVRGEKAGDLGYNAPGGLPALSNAIANYVIEARGVACTADQVIITTGAQASFDIVARLTLDPGDTVWMEEPGYLGARAVFAGAGARVVAVPVDDQGIDVQDAQPGPPRLIYVTPSHQFPLGMTMSLHRRLKLLDTARRHSAFVIEDDYDSEFRYEGRPLSSLQGLDGGGLVIYIGTFAKTLFPALRVGYVIAPRAIADAVADTARRTGQQPAYAIQAALAAFIKEGHYARHVRRMRRLYGTRLDVFRRALSGLPEGVTLGVSGTGLQLPLLFPMDWDDRAIANRLDAQGISALALTRTAMTDRTPRGLLLGFACVPEKTIVKASKRLVKTLHAYAMEKRG